MHLAKDRLDVALISDRPGISDFYRDRAGVPREEILELQSGWDQYRHALADSVLKINVRRDRPLVGRGAITEIVARGERPGTYRDEDDTCLTVVDGDHPEVEQILVRLSGPDPERILAFWTRTLDWELADERTARCGRTLVRPEKGPVPDRVGVGTSRGWNYLTVQVHDCDAEHGAACKRGAEEVLAPRNLRDVARYSFVCDPDGTPLEISERPSLTGRPVRPDLNPPPRLS